jgi:hypothetical protein
MKKLIAFVALILAGNTMSNAQLVLTGTTTSQNFDGLGSSPTATLPTGWRMETTPGGTETNYTLLETSTTQAAGTTGPDALSDTSPGGAYNFADGDNATSTDRAIGFLNDDSFVSGKSIEFAFTNATGATITELSLEWVYEKYRSGMRGWTWHFHTSTDGESWEAVPAGDISSAADMNNSTVFNPPITANMSVTISDLSIENGSTFYFRWTLVGAGGSSDGQALGIDDVTLVVTIPEPSGALLLGSGLIMLFAPRRRKSAEDPEVFPR